MKYPAFVSPWTLRAVIRTALVAAFLQPSLPMTAAILTWDSDGTAGGATGGLGTWNTSSSLWNNAGTMQAWNNATNDTALFGGTAGTVTLGAAITAGGLTFNSTGYTLAGGGNTLMLGGSVTVTTAGHLALIQSAITLSGNTTLTGSGNLTLDTASTITGADRTITKGGAGTLTLGGTITDAGTLTTSAGVTNLSGSYGRTTYLSGAGLTVNGGTLNVTGTLGTSAAVPIGQTAFQGNSTTNFSGTAFLTGASATFRIGEATNATVNVTAGTLTLGTSAAGLALGRSNANARGFLNISGGSMIVTGSATTIRIGAGYLDAETSGASVMTLSGTGLFETGLTTGTILLGSNLAGNTASTGTINLDGGTLATNRTIRGGNVGASIFNFNGGTLKANGTTATLESTLTTVNVRNGGAVIDTNGFAVTIAKALTHSDIADDNAIDGGLTKSGNGTLILSGTTADTYTGATTLNTGELHLSKTAGVNAIAGAITLRTGATSAILKLINSDQIADTSVLGFSGSGAATGIFRLNGKSETLGGLSSADGLGIVENESATAATLTLNNTGTQTFSGILRNGTLAGALSLVKNGSGTQILSSATTYTGSTTINGGTLQFGIANALNATTAVTLAGAGSSPATLNLDGFAWTAGALTFYNATSTATSQSVINIGSGGLLTLGSTTFTLNADNNPLGAQITGGTLDLGAATRTFNIADSSNAVADLTISSAITATAGAYGITKSGAGTLRLSGNVNVASTVTVTNGVLDVAGTMTNGATTTTIGSVATPGMLRLSTGADYSTTTMAIGTTAGFQGSLAVRGGTLTLTTTNTMAGIGLGGAGYGGLFLSSGTINTKRVDSLDGTLANSVTVLQVSGGTLNTSNFIMFRNENWEFTVTGGEVIRTGDAIALGFRSASTTGNTTAEGAMTVAGGVVNNSGLLVTMGQQANNTALGTTHLNLNAGTLITNQLVHYNNAGAATKSFVNFNGGLLRTSVATTLLIGTSGTGGTGSLTAYVNGAFGTFAGGAVIDTNGLNSSIPIALNAPTGDGVSTIPVTASGSGYIGAPYVEISGGGGSGATASAVVDLDPASATYGQVLSILVTNPGIGYTSAPTITLIGGGGTGAILGTATTQANTSGGLTKSGLGTLTLSGTVANTFTGRTSINDGQLDLSKTAGVTSLGGDITVGDGSTTAVLRLVNSEQIADTSVITFNGTGAEAGIFRLNNRSETLGGLSSSGGAGIVENESGSAATSTLTVNVASGIQTFSGILRNGNGAGIDGTLALTKTGAGTQVLGGLNTYTGATLINEGILQLSSGGRTGTGLVSVQTDGILSGTGIVQGSSFTAVSGSLIYAGDGTAQGDYGTLRFSPGTGAGAIDFQAGSDVILGLNPGGVSDLLSITGTGTTTLLFNGNLTVTAPGFTPTAPEVFNLLDWSGLASTPTFASRYGSTGPLYGNGDEATGLDLPDIFGSGYAWDLSGFTTNGSISLYLIAVVPEPSRMILLGLGLGLLLVRRRR